jgi:hypothetical protein
MPPRDGSELLGKSMPLCSPSTRNELSACGPGFDPCLFACRLRRGMQHLVVPATLSRTSGYRMDAPRARARGCVHACVLRASAPQRRAEAWPLVGRAVRLRATPLDAAPHRALAWEVQLWDLDRASPPPDASSISPNTWWAETPGMYGSVEPQLSPGSMFGPRLVQGWNLNFSVITNLNGVVIGSWPIKVRQGLQPALVPWTFKFGVVFWTSVSWANWAECNGPFSPTNTLGPTSAH